MEIFPGKEFSYTWKDYGLKVHIPADALDPDTPPTTMTIQASLSGNYQLPHMMELVSAIYWITFPRKYSQPVRLNLQHCALVESNDDISSLEFITAKCNQEKLPYHFKVISGGVFELNHSYGTIELSHFSGFGIGSRRSKRKYSIRTYYIPYSSLTWLVHITITRNLKALLSVSAIICYYVVVPVII